MSRVSTWLLEHKHDVFSQTGEDGIIAKILEVISENDKWCVEFGAWDGMYLTNTRNLIESRGYSAVLIEADKHKFQNLQKNYAQKNNVMTICRFVGFTKEDNLDHILSATPVPLNFDLLSIDIDGNDYYMWKSVAKYRPKLVVIEFNPTIPTSIRFVQPNQGASLLALVELAKEKGYELVSVLPFNAFFVKQEYYQRFQIESNAPEALRTNLDAVTYFFSGFDGTIFLRGGCTLLWHGINLDEASFQRLPKFLRTFPGNYTIVQKAAFALYLLFTNPSRVIKVISAWLSRVSKNDF